MKTTKYSTTYYTGVWRDVLDETSSRKQSTLHQVGCMECNKTSVAGCGTKAENYEFPLNYAVLLK